MKTYKIEITETLQKTIDICAETMEDAIMRAREMYEDEDVVLSAEDCIDTDFNIVDNITTKNVIIEELQIIKEGIDTEMYEKFDKTCEKIAFNEPISSVDFPNKVYLFTDCNVNFAVVDNRDNHLNVVDKMEFKHIYESVNGVNVYADEFEETDILFINKDYSKAVLVNAINVKTFIQDVMNEYFNEEIRICSGCGEIIQEGYVVYDDYLCEDCRKKSFSDEFWNILHKTSEDDYYWTSWG